MALYERSKNIICKGKDVSKINKLYADLLDKKSSSRHGGRPTFLIKYNKNFIFGISYSVSFRFGWMIRFIVATCNQRNRL